MTQLSVYGGLFSDPPLISTDGDPKRTDPYDKMDTIPSRYLGKGMSIGRSGTGQNAEVYFDKKYLTLASPEQNGNKDLGAFEDADTRMRREAMESKKKNISEKVFLLPSYPKWSDGPGSYSGCFQDRPYPFILPGENDKKSRRRKKAAVTEVTDKNKSSLPNIKTNRTKKGTYGVPGTLLDNPKYNDNWRQEMEKLDALRAKREKNVPQPKPMGSPFKTPGVTHDFLDELHATGVSAVYHYEPVEEKSPKRKGRVKSPAAVAVFTQERPMSFKRTKSGQEGCIADFPNTWIDPDALERERNKGKKKNRKPKPEYVPSPPKGASGIWKPNSFPEASVVQSCLRRFY
ncbi:hypothetical protein C3747_14g32 [Trypanosoma cruzi]|uniref:Uncharacterized protein n=2 Tax=Trypanosoma cruzi TaxID=5693 RepID=Q4E651_TRYCC|nr:hypothetical protein, conserved [Trypanosoma cruzi]EAO00208.1 hypothetical protein, conserved [Trypanosoma cruzi]PWV18154.1 hypothetical protein C3747_14g32 [Trypanosoma cruzi]|eukprot:XP_822059.1 hypothetical protein [Trypanosoma cruzi strain CL Brener]